MTAATGYLVAASLYAGFQLTIRMVVYPQMALAGSEGWPRYEAAHQSRVSLLAGPLFAALVASIGWLALSPDGTAWWPLAAVLLAGLLLVTVAGAVPQHRTLGPAFDTAAHRRLLAWDSARVVLAVAQLLLALALVS